MSLIAIHELNIPPTDPQVYNCHDCCGTWQLFEKMSVLPQYGPIYNLERGLQGPVMEMMLRGFLIDPLARDRALIDIKSRLDGISQFLNTLSLTISSEGLSYYSSKQIKHLFYDIMHIKPIKKSFKGETKIPMDEETLEKLRLKYPKIRSLCAGILAARNLAKQKEKYEMEVDSDWRIRTSINIAGTNEIRSSNSKSVTGTGGNLQNVSPLLRSMFISDKNFKLFGLDKEQAESRWVGLYCGILFDDWSYLDALESGDGHTSIARMVWEKDLPWNGDLKHDRQTAEKLFYKELTYRQACKIAGHATNIMGKPYTISIHTGIPKNLVEDFQEKYFTAFPCISLYHRWIAKQIQSKQYLVNIFGAQRDFFDHPESEDTIKKGCAWMQAGSNACDLKLGQWRSWYHMKDRIQLLTEEHDALYGQFKEKDDELDVISELQKHLKVEFDLGFRKFSVPTEAKTGWNKGLRWSLDKSGRSIETNPRGLDKPGARR